MSDGAVLLSPVALIALPTVIPQRTGSDRRSEHQVRLEATTGFEAHIYFSNGGFTRWECAGSTR